MKNIIFLLVIFNLVSCNYFDDTEKMTKKFQNRFEKITEISPQQLILAYYRHVENSGVSSPYRQFTPEMHKRQELAMYSGEVEKLAKLIVDILIYKKITKKKGLEIEDLTIFVDRIKSKPKDKLDKLIIKSYDLMYKYQEEKLIIESSIGYY